MTEEEKKAIELLKEFKNGILDLASKNLDNEDILMGTFSIKKDKIYLFDILLNLIQKKDTEINKLNNVIDRMVKWIYELFKKRPRNSSKRI